MKKEEKKVVETEIQIVKSDSWILELSGEEMDRILTEAIDTWVDQDDRIINIQMVMYHSGICRFLIYIEKVL